MYICINAVMNDTRDWCGYGLQVVRYIVTIIICQVKDARSLSRHSPPELFTVAQIYRPGGRLKSVHCDL